MARRMVQLYLDAPPAGRREGPSGVWYVLMPCPEGTHRTLVWWSPATGSRNAWIACDKESPIPLEDVPTVAMLLMEQGT